MLRKLIKADEIKVALVAGICIIGTALFFKYTSHIKPGIIASNGPAFLMIVYLITRGSTKDSKCSSWLWWSIAIISVTIFNIVIRVL